MRWRLVAASQHRSPRETAIWLEAVGVEAYLQRALQTDQPLLIGQPEQTPRLEVLDQRLETESDGFEVSVIRRVLVAYLSAMLYVQEGTLWGPSFPERLRDVFFVCVVC